MSNVVCLINSRQDLEAIYSGSRELPEFDFDKYTLIIGQQIMPCRDFYLVKKELLADVNGLVLNLYVRNDGDNLSTAIQHLYYWGVYPKLVQKSILVKDFKDYPNHPDL